MAKTKRKTKRVGGTTKRIKKATRKSSKVVRSKSKFSKHGKRKSKSVRSKSRSKQRRDSTKVILNKKSVSVGQKNQTKRKSVLKINLGKTKVELDSTIMSRVNLKQVIKRFIDQKSVKKKFKISKETLGMIRVVFKDEHKAKKKLRKENDTEYNSKKHNIAVSTSLIRLNSIKDFVQSVDFLMDFLQDDIERYLKYTKATNKTSLQVDYIELVKYENDVKKNQKRQKTKKRPKKIRSRRR